MEENEQDPLLGPRARVGFLPSKGDAELSTSSTGSYERNGETSDPTASNVGRGRVYTVALFCIIACMNSAIAGVTLSYSSGTILELDMTYNDGDHDRGVQEDSTFASLIGSFSALGALFGGPCAWPVSDRLGRKPALMIGGVVTLIGWLPISCLASPSISSREALLGLILVGRLVTGFGAGWAVFCVSVYVAEVASAKLKGLFGACNQLFITLGALIGFGLGGFAVSFEKFAYYHIAMIAVGIVVIFEVLMIFTRETPRWLLAHGKDAAGTRVLQILRGHSVDIQTEVEGIKKSIEKSKGLSFAEVIPAIKHPSVYIPFTLVMFLMLFQQFSGINVIIVYAGTVLKQAGVAGSGSDAEKKVTIMATMSVGVVQVVMTCVAVALVDYLGRRVLLVASSIGLLVSTVLLGVHFFIVNRKCHGCLGINCTDDNNVTHLNDFSPCDSTHLGWLAVVSVALFIGAFSIGWGPIPWISMSELLPLRVRGLLGSVATMWNWLLVFIITESFQSYADKVTAEFAWWSFSVMMVLSIVFVFLFLPETKGHTLEEIEDNFEHGRVFAVSCKRRGRGSINVNEKT